MLAFFVLWCLHGTAFGGGLSRIYQYPVDSLAEHEEVRWKYKMINTSLTNSKFLRVYKVIAKSKYDAIRVSS